MRAILLAMTVLLVAIPMAAQEPESPEPVFVPLPAGAEILRLENGLEVVLLPNPSQPMVGAYCQVKVGSAWEDFATSGTSHMLEHLLFNGTERYTQDELYAAADKVGAYNNAHTTDFYTDFMMVLPAEHLAAGLELQSQMLFHSLIPAEKFPKEQGIVLGELAQSRDRGDPFFATTLREVMDGGSSLALPTLGTAATIAALDRDRVHAFYKTWYVPNNMILTVAGRFDRTEALALIEEHYGNVPPRSLPAQELRLAAPIDHTTSTVRRGGRSREAALVFAAPEYGTPDHAAFEVASELLTTSGSGILVRALEDLPEDERPEMGTWWRSAPGFGRYVLEFSLTATTPPEDLYPLIRDAVSGALEAGLDPDDLAAVVARYRTDIFKQREQLRMTGIYIADQLVLGGADALLGHLDQLAAVTVDDVAAALANWFVDRPCQALLVEPAGAGTGETTTTDAQLDRTVLTGGSVLVTQTDPHSELMAVHLAVRDRGRLDQELGRPGALNLLHRLLTVGVAGCDEACLARRLGAIGAEIKLVDNPRFPMDNYYTNGRFSFVRLECPAEHGEAALALLVELVQYSTFTEDDVDRERQAQQQLLARSARSASARSRQALRDALYGDHPLALPAEGTPESVVAATYDDLRQLYREAFQPQNLIVAVVSPHQHEEVVGMLKDLPTTGQERQAMPPLPLTAGAETIRLEAAGSPMGSVRTGAVRTVDTADEPALEMLAAVLSDRLQMDLRETRGLGYSVGASLTIRDQRAEFTAWVNPPLARVDEAATALASALRAFDAATITQDELDAARNSRRGRLMMRRLDSISRAYYLTMAELDHGDTTPYATQLDRHASVTLADLVRAQGFFSELPLVTVRVQ